MMANMIAHVVDVKRAFLHGEFEDGEKIHMKIPRGFKKYFSAESVILLLKCLYGLKQAAKAFWRQLLCAAKRVGTSTEQCRSLSLLQMGSRESCHDDVMD